MIDISNKVFALIAIGILAGIQLGAWYMGFNGQVTLFVTSCIVGLLGFSTGINFMNIKK